MKYVQILDHLKSKMLMQSYNWPVSVISWISTTSLHTRRGHCDDIVDQLLGRTLSSIISGDYSHPVHVHGLQALHTEGGRDDGGGVTAGPLDALSVPYLDKIPLRFILLPWFILRFSPGQDEVAVRRFCHLQAQNFPRRLLGAQIQKSSNNICDIFGICCLFLSVIQKDFATLTLGIPSKNKLRWAAEFTSSREVYGSNSELIFHTCHDVFHCIFPLCRLMFEKKQQSISVEFLMISHRATSKQNLQTFD